jgi:hypothetical protein
MARKAKDTPHLRLRIEPSLLARLEKSAEKNGRTLTGEIVDRIEGSFKRDDMQALVEATAQRIAEKLTAVSESSKKAHAIIDDEMFDLDLKHMSELFPDTPIDELERKLREANARRAALRGEQ